MSIASELARRVTALRYEDLPPQAVYWCKIALLDTLGVGLAGSVEEAPHLVADVLEFHDGPSLVLGSSRRVGPLDAALVNATAAHVLDFDNTAANMGGHVSAVMVPALLAAAEAYAASGRDLLLAHAVGYEVGGRIGCGVNFHHSEMGWHPTSTLGVFAVAASCARLLKLTAAQTETALAISTSLAGGTKANFGTMTKSLHAGQCARAGLWAALLARKGFTANPEAFEHPQGFFNVFNGAGHYDAARVLERWADPLEIVAPGASYKLYPCCYSTHSAVEAALNLVRKYGKFDAGAMAAIDITIAPPRLLHTDRPDPKTALEAKFSVQYCVARALLDGKVVLSDFENDAYLDPRVRAVLPRVKATAYVGRAYDSDDPYDVEVKVSLTDGTVRAIAASYPLGRTSDYPIPSGAIRSKFEDCARRVLTREAATAAALALESFEQYDSVRDFTRLIEPAAANNKREGLDKAGRARQLIAVLQHNGGSMKVLITICAALFSAAAVSDAVAADSQNYPTRPIRVVTGQPGGGSDLAARLIANSISDGLGQPMVIENRPGGNIPREILLKAPPDGYTLLVTANGMWLRPFMAAHTSYDPIRDFTPVSLITNSPNILVVHPSLAANSLKELIALARAKPGMLNCSTASSGSSSHLAYELFKSMAKVDIVRIPYKGNGPAVADLVAGQVQLSFSTPTSVTPHLKTGKLKGLAVTSLEPYPPLSNLPTAASSGLPGYESATLNGIFAPGKTPAAVINKLNREIVRVLHRPEVKNKLLDTGILVVGSSPQELGAKVKSEMSRLGKVLKDAGVVSEE